MEHVPQVIHSLAPMINHYGYWAVGLIVIVESFGIPAPGMTIVVVAAFFAGLGHLSLPLVALVAFLAATVGDSIGFAIGRTAGEPLIKRYGKYVRLTPKRVKASKKFFERNGGKVVLIARFIDGLRQFNGIIAGLSDMRWRKFLAYNASGAILWVVVWSLAGFYGGKHINLFIKIELYIAIAVVVIIVGFIIYKLMKRRRADS